MFLSLLELLKCCIELTFFSFSFPYRKEKFIVYVFTVTNLKQTFLSEDSLFSCLPDSYLNMHILFYRNFSFSVGIRYG